MTRRLFVLALVLPVTAAVAWSGGRVAPPAHLKHLSADVLHVGPAPQGVAKLAAGETGRLWLPGGEREFQVETVLSPDGRASTRFGTIRGVGRAAVTLGVDGGFARVTEGATIWSLEIRDGATFAVRVGEGGLALADFDHGALGVGPSAADDAAALKAAGAAAGSPVGKAANLRPINMLALYDSEFAARYPGNLAETRIDHVVALANQAFVDSRVAAHLVVREYQPVSSTLLAPSALDNVSTMRNALIGTVSFAGINITQLRADTGADLISLFRVHDMYAKEVCGVAYFPNTSDDGVNVVMDGVDGGSTCDDYVFAHEVGHNLGARHQYPADPSINSAHGFVRPGQFTTIMGSLGTGNADRLRIVGYFSNPLIACGNLPCGDTTESNNAGIMNLRASMVSGYVLLGSDNYGGRPAPTNADSDGDGAIDRIDAFPFDPLETVDADGDGVPASRDAFPGNGDEWLDSDSGGLGDNADADDDNDGTPDAGDAFPLDPLEWADADDDGTGDNADPFDADAYEQRDSDLDGLGDRADPDDDQDAVTDVATLATVADGELLVADGATDRILRFRGSDMAPLGTLVQLAPGEVTVRSEMAAAPSGELYFVGASELRRLDRLRSATPQLFLSTYLHPQIGTGFPLSPVVTASGDVVASEWGNGAIMAMRPGLHPEGTPTLIRQFWTTVAGKAVKFHLARHPSGDVGYLDGAGGDAQRLHYDLSAGFAAPTGVTAYGLVATPYSSGSVAYSRNGGVLVWADRRDGALRNAVVDGGAAVPVVTTADARAVTVGPDGVTYVARRSGGVQRYSESGVDLGQALAAAAVAEPLALAWVPRILDTSLPAIVPPTPPATTSDGASTPASGGVAPLPPPCTTACVPPDSGGGGGGGGGGGPIDPLLALLLAVLLLEKRRAR